MSFTRIFRIPAMLFLALAVANAPAAFASPNAVSHATDSGPRASAWTPEAVNAEPTADELSAAEGPAVLRAQVLLDRVHFSSGALNGRADENTGKAVYFFQQANGLTPTGKLDEATYSALEEQAGKIDGVVKITITPADLRGPYRWIPISAYDEAKLPCLCYASALEMFDERYHTVTAVLQRLNPSVYFGALQPGMEIWVPNVHPFELHDLNGDASRKRVTRIEISKSGEYLHAYAADGSLLFHFPTSVGSAEMPSPSGTYHVSTVQWRPVYHYSPALFGSSGPTATLPPGPNSPVGIVWIATSKDHVGIHGTPIPHTISAANSHGCVRLTNWDAARLAASVKRGAVIRFMK